MPSSESTVQAQIDNAVSRAPNASAEIATRRARLVDALGLTPEIIAVSTAMFVMGLGENL